jgi:glycosyltransferase involved in cell wall biosynthesis
LYVGNISPHKNLNWILEEAKINRNDTFVIVGKNVLGINYSDNALIPENVILTGYVTDEENKALMLHAKALLFPSFCEGFGIPPLEMLALGKKIIISNCSCLPDIFKSSALYIDPRKNDYVLSEIEDNTDSKDKKEVLNNNSWNNAAKQWIALLETHGGE